MIETHGFIPGHRYPQFCLSCGLAPTSAPHAGQRDWPFSLPATRPVHPIDDALRSAALRDAARAARSS